MRPHSGSAVPPVQLLRMRPHGERNWAFCWRWTVPPSGYLRHWQFNGRYCWLASSDLAALPILRQFMTLSYPWSCPPAPPGGSCKDRIPYADSLGHALSLRGNWPPARCGERSPPVAGLERGETDPPWPYAKHECFPPCEWVNCEPERP